MTVQELEYIHNNPLKRGYVDEAIHWSYQRAQRRLTWLDRITDWQ